MMRKVLYSLVPIVLFATYLFGLRVLALLAVVCAVGVAVEYLILRYINGKDAKVSEAVFVSCVLFTMTLPPAIPFWIAAVGIAFGVFFAKGVFGGFGKNIFNPALAARCFIYVSFPVAMTTEWTTPFTAFPGGLLRFTPGIDALTAATPMGVLKATGEHAGYAALFFGTIPGSIGETSALLILLAAVYLLVTKTANWRLMLSTLVTFLAVDSVLYFTGVIKADPLSALLGGATLFAIVFMVTDPISAPQNNKARFLYGALIAVASIVIRSFSLFAGGFMFAILIGNVFAPLIDQKAKAFDAKRAAKRKAVAA
jgi:Na+-transporting NADH:ubiquinone oxidoreductase subunit B